MKVYANEFALFEYHNNPTPTDKFSLGDVVISTQGEGIGVIIQCHGNNEYRTDQFGNCCYDENPKYSNIDKASVINVLMNRPSLFDFKQNPN
jgi:hypothetical protein